jgi:hypothetical protein
MFRPKHQPFSDDVLCPEFHHDQNRSLVWCGKMVDRREEGREEGGMVYAINEKDEIDGSRFGEDAVAGGERSRVEMGPVEGIEGKVGGLRPVGDVLTEVLADEGQESGDVCRCVMRHQGGEDDAE